MLRRVLYLLAFLPLSVFAQQSGPPLAAELQRIQRQFAQEERTFTEAYRNAATDEQRNQLKFPDRDKYASEVLALAEKNVKDPAAVDALIWTLVQARHGSEPATKALALLQNHYVEDQRMDAVCEALEFEGSNASQALLKELIEKNSHGKVKAAAALALGRIHAADNPQQAEHYFKDVGKYGTPAQVAAARQQLFEMQNLAIGKAVPEIEGEDVDGKKFKLSDYRGKVVVIDFWGDW